MSFIKGIVYFIVHFMPTVQDIPSSDVAICASTSMSEIKWCCIKKPIKTD